MKGLDTRKPAYHAGLVFHLFSYLGKLINLQRCDCTQGT